MNAVSAIVLYGKRSTLQDDVRQLLIRNWGDVTQQRQEADLGVLE